MRYGNDFHLTDLAAIASARFDGTCEWITDDPRYKQWSSSSSSATLWIEAGPGAGKTILASYIIIHQRAFSNQQCFYYFFKGTDSYRHTPLAAAKCLLSQAYSYCQRERPDIVAKELDTLAAAVIEDGYAKSRSFEITWAIFVSFVSSIGNCRVIIDGLDECSQPSLFLNLLLTLSAECATPVAITCRSGIVTMDLNSIDTVQVLSLGSSHHGDLSLYIAHRASRLTARVPLDLRTAIVDRLIEKHNGMFLWVCLVFEELESIVTLKELRGALRDLPEGIDEVYHKIIQNLNMLSKPNRRLCHKTFTWLCACQRPLRLDWLYEAMRFEYQEEDEEGFFHTPQSLAEAIKTAFGPLVIVEADVVVFVHFTLKQFLDTAAVSGTVPFQFEIRAQQAHRHLLQVALSYMESTKAAQYFGSSRPAKAIVDRATLDADSTGQQLLGYCTFHWIDHLMACDISPKAIQILSRFGTASSSLVWGYLVLILDGPSLDPSSGTWNP